MDSVDVLYERIDHVLAVSSGKFHNTLSVKPDKVLKISYSDYIKSQLHLNIVTNLFGRPIHLYKKAYDYLAGDIRHVKTAQKVLEYFYEDIINFLKYNKHNVKIELIVDVKLPNKIKEYNYSEIKEGLLKLKSSDFKNLGEALAFLEDNPKLNSVIDYINNRATIMDRLDSYCVIAILLNHKIGKSLVWEVN